jgi:hypothetical protein
VGAGRCAFQFDRNKVYSNAALPDDAKHGIIYKLKNFLKRSSSPSFSPFLFFCCFFIVIFLLVFIITG